MKYLGMTIHCIGIVISGIWFSSTVFDANWPDIDSINRINISTDTIEKTTINSRDIKTIKGSNNR